MPSSKTIIIGSGPAGCTAAIYAARANLHPILITGMNEGGQLLQTPDIQNWPGEPSISGADLMNKLNQIILFALCEDLDHSVFHIPDGTGEIVCQGLLHAEGAKADTLDASFHDHVISLH